MKKLFTSLFLFISLISFAQEITYYNEDGEKVGKEEPYYRSEITVPDSSSKKQVIVKRFRPDGSLATWDTYKNKNKMGNRRISLIRSKKKLVKKK